VGIRNIEFLIQEAFVGIWRNGIMAVASLSTIALSLAILGSFGLLILGAHNFVDRELGKFDIAVFLDPNLSSDREQDILSTVKTIPSVKSVEFVPKEVSWPSFKKELSADIELGGIVKNPLPDAMRVRVADPRQTETVAQKIRDIEGIHRVREARQELNYVIAVADFIKYVGIVAIIVLFATATFIISNAIRLTMYARRREIRIMQLVGATNVFIQTPLVIEGIVLGVIGGLIAAGIVSMCGSYLTGVIHRMMPLVRQVSSGVNPAQFAVMMALTGATIGAIGSTMSIKKFLKY
jgi:cell division transport system permease protein